MNWGDAKIAWHDAFRGFVQEYDGPRYALKGNLGKIGFMFEAGKVQSVVAKIPQKPREWGMFCYAPDHGKTERYKRRVADRLYCELLSETPDLAECRLKMTRFLILINLCIQERLVQQWSENGAKWMASSEKADLLEIPRQNWRRDGWWLTSNRIQNKLVILCDQALRPVARLCAEEREKIFTERETQRLTG